MTIFLAFARSESSILREATSTSAKRPPATTSTMTPPRLGRRDGVVAAHGLGYAYAKRAKRAARARSISSWEARGGGDFGVNLKLSGLEKYPVVGGRISTSIMSWCWILSSRGVSSLLMHRPSKRKRSEAMSTPVRSEYLASRARSARAGAAEAGRRW